MKTILKAALVAIPVSITAMGAEPVVCTITTSGSSANTSSPTTGTCSWPKGATVLVQCDQSVYLDSTSVLGVAPTASSSDELVDFASNKDPKIVYLNNQDHLS